MMKWISIEVDEHPVNRVCFLSCGDRIKFGARIVINAEDDPRPEFAGYLERHGSSERLMPMVLQFDIDNILHPTHWMPLPSLPTI